MIKKRGATHILYYGGKRISGVEKQTISFCSEKNMLEPSVRQLAGARAPPQIFFASNHLVAMEYHWHP